MKAFIKKFIEVMNTRNVGAVDRFFRISIGVILIGLGIYYHNSLELAIALVFFGINTALTGIRGVCSIYYMLGYSSCPINQGPNSHLK